MNNFFIYTIGIASIIYPWIVLFLLGWAAAASRGLRASDIDIRLGIIVGYIQIIALAIQLMYIYKNVMRIPIIVNLSLSIALVLIIVF